MTEQVQVEVEVKDGLVNPVLKDQLLTIVQAKGKEKEVILEQHSELEDRTYRLIYLPQVVGENIIVNFAIGNGATVEEQGNNEAFGPRYVDNVINISSVMFPNEDSFVNYVTNYWTSIVLHTFFTNEFDQGYRLTSVALNAMQSEEAVTFTKFADTDHEGVYDPATRTVNYVNPENGAVLFSHALQAEQEDRMFFVNEFMQAWETIAALDARIIEAIVENPGLNAQELGAKIMSEVKDVTDNPPTLEEEEARREAKASEPVVEEELEDEVFDLDGDLYGGLEGNSATPIDASEPEVIDEELLGCSGGGCTL